MEKFSMITFNLSKQAITMAVSLGKVLNIASSLESLELIGILSGLVSAVTEMVEGTTSI